MRRRSTAPTAGPSGVPIPDAAGRPPSSRRSRRPTRPCGPRTPGRPDARGPRPGVRRPRRARPTRRRIRPPPGRWRICWPTRAGSRTRPAAWPACRPATSAKPAPRRPGQLLGDPRRRPAAAPRRHRGRRARAPPAGPENALTRGQRARSASMISSRWRAPVEARPVVAHRRADAAHQHRDVGRAHVGAHRPGRLGPTHQLVGHPSSIPCSGRRLLPDALAGPEHRVLDRRVAGGEGRRCSRSRSANTSNGSPSSAERGARVDDHRRQLLAHELAEQGLLGREVAVDRPDADPGQAGDLVHLRLGARRRRTPRARPRGSARGCAARRRAVGGSVSSGWSHHRSFTSSALTNGIIVPYACGAQTGTGGHLP